MARNFAFVPATIDALDHGTLADPETPGLAITACARGRKRWKYRRWISGTEICVKMTLGTYPNSTIAAARTWAQGLDAMVERGIDPREVDRATKARAAMTVAKAHLLYMTAVREGRSSRAKRLNKPRTISDKQEIYNREIAPVLSHKVIYEVSENDLISLVEAKGKTARIRANRLAAELKVFFGWAASLRGLEVGLETNPSSRLGDLRYPETPRSRKLSRSEISWFLKALAPEEWYIRRGMLLWLLTAARIAEVSRARSDEVVDGVWTIPVYRTKNSRAHRIPLGPWAKSLMASDSKWVFPAPKTDGPRTSGWYKARDRVKSRMEAEAGRSIERFTPHDFRRTARSNTKRLKIDYETAEAMMNHAKVGLDRIYDLYELEDEKRDWFLRWEKEIASIAAEVGVADRLGVPRNNAQLVDQLDGMANVGNAGQGGDWTWLVGDGSIRD